MTLDQLLEIHDRAGLSTYEQETIISFINGVRLENGNYPTLSLFFVQITIH